jgi:hypothetical protein
MYTALRDGLAYLAKTGLATTTKTIEFGSKEKDLEGHAHLLRRAVYKVELTEAGLDVVDLWEDISDYVTRRWSQRIRTREAYAAA